MQITDAAVFSSRLSKWDELFDGLPVHAIEWQLYYNVDFEPVGPEPGASHFVVDVSETFDVKMQSIRCYETQFPPEKAHVFDYVDAATRYTGSQAGFFAGELFTCTKTLGTPDLMKTLFPK